VLGAVSPERLATLYDAADLFVLASYFEGYGMAFSEALAHGLPVIGTKTGAVEETVPNEAGLLVTPGNSEELAGALYRVLTDTGLRLRLAEGAFVAAQHLPSWSQSGVIFGSALERLQ